MRQRVSFCRISQQGDITLDKNLELLKKIAPEMVSVLEMRWRILRNIYLHQPIGRRTLAHHLKIPERPLRAQVQNLSQMGLLEIQPSGMRVTPSGVEVIQGLEGFIFDLKGLDVVAKAIEKRFGCQKVSIVQGNSDEDVSVKLLLGREAGYYLKKYISDGDVVAVNGGTTVAAIPRAMTPISGLSGVVVVPGRGGMGESVELQANTIAAKLAEKLGAHYRPLYLPDNIGAESMETLAQEPGIREVIGILRRTNILIHGIGGAEEVARRRGLPEEEIREIKAKGAVSEVFGYYFNAQGKIVHTTTSVGLTSADLDNIGTVIAIAGGANKAPAIQAYLKYHSPTVLVTDEGAATKLLQLEGGD
jgi:central glycolytic genes regulator